MRATAQRLPGDRLHLSDGPIDLLIWVEGSPAERHSAYRSALNRFLTILDELVEELPLLRQALPHHSPPVEGAVAVRMLTAATPYQEKFVTPMIAVAGSVADEVLAAMLSARDYRRAYVNNGGDIAVHVSPGTSLRIGIIPVPGIPGLASPNRQIEINDDSKIGGIATSGFNGRSLSFGIADSVTVAACDAATADVAATLIGNEVYAEHPSIRRKPAIEIDPDSDLGLQKVTVARGAIPQTVIQSALDRGAKIAQSFVEQKLITGAFLTCFGRDRIVGGLGNIITSLPGSLPQDSGQTCTNLP